MLYTGMFFDFGFIKLTYCFQQHLFCIDFRKVLLFEKYFEDDADSYNNTTETDNYVVHTDILITFLKGVF